MKKAKSDMLSMIKEGTTEWNQYREQFGLGLVDLSGVSVSGVDLEGVDLSYCDLSNVRFNNVNLANSKLTGSNLFGAEFTGTNLADSELRHCVFHRTRLEKACLARTNCNFGAFFLTNMNSTDLTESDLSNAVLTNPSLKGTNFNGTRFSLTSLVDLDICEAKNLGAATHVWPSNIGIRTLSHTHASAGGKFPDECYQFFQNAGVPLSVLDNFARLKVPPPVISHSCFISYSSKDQKFAEKLHRDLEKRGVPCWFAPHDMKIGDKIRKSIDSAVRQVDRTLLILSADSVASGWVEDEVEATFTEERESGNTLLLPIRIDDACMSLNVSWMRKIKNTRHIGNFSNWKNRNEYRKSLEQLATALRMGFKIRSK